ncbi:MAG: TonB-dependent receptor plug domain-containing protein, partial [Henriciella sp.]
MNLIRKLGLGASTVALLAVVPAYAQDESGEELRQNTVTVTGSFIAGTPEDAALPVDVIGAADLQDIGSPTVNEILRNLPATQGLIGETNQFDTRGGQGNEGATTINLRGLGSARTLVLVNGKRHVSTSVIGTDVNFVPAAAIGSIEVLKDGAAALYGSDAIGGVVNFRTRSDFEGFELRASQQFIQDSDGDIEIGGIWGHSGDKFNLIIAGEYGYRDELQVKDRDWALLDYADNPQGGWSSVGNPGTLINPGFIPIAAGAGVPPVVFGQVDPNCNVLGGFNTPIASTGGGICRFQYTYFDNLIEETEQYKLMGELNYEINANTNLNVQAAWSKLEIPEWNTSPSYPPQS